MTNREIRSWYLREVSKIASLDREWQNRGDSLDVRAQEAWQRRHDLRLRAREMMEDPAEVELLRARDFRLYGNLDGPTLDDLIQRLRSRSAYDIREPFARSDESPQLQAAGAE